MDHSHEGAALPDNYETEIPVYAGLIAGIAGSFSIMLVVLAILVVNQRDIFTAARLIATIVYGPDAAEGLMPIIVGTLVHLVTGGTFGAVFAWFMPRLPRPIWIVAGLLYGMGVWLVSTFIVLPILAPPMIAADANIGILALTHFVYGLVLGIAGATYELWWRLPRWIWAEP